MSDLALDLLLALLVMLAIYGTGRALRRLVRLEFWSHAADLAYAFAFGVGATTTLLFVCALLGWLLPVTGWVVLAVGVGLAALQYRSLWQDLTNLWNTIRGAVPASWLSRWATVIVLGFALVNLIADLAPPVEGDTVHQYLLVPRYWVEAGRYIQPSHIWAATLPGNMMMLSAWALLLHDSFSLATLLTGFGMSALLALGVYTLARGQTSREAALLAAAFIYTMPDAGYLAQSAKVDMGWAFFEALALAAFFRWLDLTPLRIPGRVDTSSRRPLGWIILAGVCLGLAAGTKNQTWISIALLGLWLAGRCALRGEWRLLLRSATAFGLAVLAAALPYYLYNGIVHLNPFYPVFADQFTALFGATPSPRSELGTEVFYPWTVWGYLENLWNASLGHTAPGFYLGFIAGPVYLLLLPIGFLMGAWRGQRTGRLIGYAFVFSVVWFLVKQAVRHFLPGLALLAAAAGSTAWHLATQPARLGRLLQALVVVALVGNLVSMLGVLYWSGAYRVALGIETRDEFLERFLDEVTFAEFADSETVAYLNDLSEPARVLAEHPGNTLYIRPDVVSGAWGDRNRLDAITDPDQMLSQLARQHIDYILASKTPTAERPYFARPEFLDQYAELIYEGTRARLYCLNN